MDNSSSGLGVAFFVCAAIGVTSLVAGLYFAAKTIQFRLRAVQVEAVLTDSVETQCEDPDRGRSVGSREPVYYTCYEPIVEYEMGEYIYTTGLVDRRKTPYEPGTTFRILIDRMDPQRVMMQDRYWVFSALLIVFGAFFLLGGYVFRNG